MINTESIEPIVGNVLTPEEGRAVDPFNDPEMVRLVAVNLELAVRNGVSRTHGGHLHTPSSGNANRRW
ncbi:MAG: hypothetical protein ACXABD_18875 [Candidatus Thorarchaeota archaeon]|jgi:hypothetical protein